MRDWDNETRQTHWWVGNGYLRLLSRLPDTPPMFGMPVLSNDGHWVAWMESIPGSKLHRAVVQSLNDEQTHLVDIPNQRLLLWELLAADMERKELTFYDYDYTTRRSSLTTLGLDSEQHGDSIVAQGVDAQFTTILRVGSGWVAWDAAREPGQRYRVAWSLANGRGTHIRHYGAALSPPSKWIRMEDTLLSARPTGCAIVSSRMPSTSFARVMARKSGTGSYRRIPAVRSPFSARSFSSTPIGRSALYSACLADTRLDLLALSAGDETPGRPREDYILRAELRQLRVHARAAVPFLEQGLRRRERRVCVSTSARRPNLRPAR